MSLADYNNSLLMQPNFDSDTDTDDESAHDEQCQDSDLKTNVFPEKTSRPPQFLSNYPQNNTASIFASPESMQSYIYHGKSGYDIHENQSNYKLCIDPSELEKRRNTMQSFYQKLKDTHNLAKDTTYELGENGFFRSIPLDNNENNINQENPNNNNGNNNNLNRAIGFLVGAGNHAAAIDEEEEVRQNEERMQNEAAQIVANVILRYRESNVPEEDFLLVRRAQEENENGNQTLHRVLIGVLALITASICIVVQTLPLFTETTKTTDMNGLDVLLRKIMHIRDFRVHATNCGVDLERTRIVSINKNVGGKKETVTFDCADEVLHIPSVSHLQADSSNSALDPIYFAKNGVNASWNIHCKIPPAQPNQTYDSNSCFPVKRHTDKTCSENKEGKSKNIEESIAIPQCFRGVHDGMISQSEVQSVLLMARNLINNGSTHLDIHTNTSYLQEYVPSVIAKLKHMLSDRYKVGNTYHPTAFRVSITLPIDPEKWSFQSRYSNFTDAINLKTLAKLEAHIRKHNFQSPLKRNLMYEPYRDPCILISDLEANDKFCVHTSIFLSGDSDFSGGASFYIDDYPDNSNPRKKIKRGLVVDGSVGRIIVSSGGFENRRCRFPTREGIRAVLQVWWNCAENEEVLEAQL